MFRMPREAIWKMEDQREALEVTSSKRTGGKFMREMNRATDFIRKATHFARKEECFIKKTNTPQKIAS